MSRHALGAAFTGSTVFESGRHPNKPPLRLVSVPIIYRGSLLYIVQVGTTLEGVEETLRRFLLVLVVMAPIALGSHWWEDGFWQDVPYDPSIPLPSQRNALPRAT